MKMTVPLMTSMFYMSWDKGAQEIGSKEGEIYRGAKYLCLWETTYQGCSEQLPHEDWKEEREGKKRLTEGVYLGKEECWITAYEFSG